jgi:hypothetical protein
MANFAKLFQVTPTCQVLVIITYNENENRDEITQTTIIDGITVTVGMSFATEDDANKAFDDYNQSDADRFFGGAETMVTGTNNDDEQSS